MALNDGIVRDQIIIGTVDKNLKERLLREADLNLDKTERLCCAAEVATKQMSTMQNSFSNVNVDTNPYRNDKPGLINCRNCASKHPIRNCPAFGKTCFNCNQKNHFSRCCRKPRRRPGNQRNVNMIQNMNNYDDRNENTNTEEENQFFINSIDICEENSFDDDVKLEWTDVYSKAFS